MDRPGVKVRRTSISPETRASESPQKPPVASRRPTGFGDRALPVGAEDRRVAAEEDGKGSRRAYGEKDERKTGVPVREAKDAGEKRLYSDMEDRKTGADRTFRDRKDKWAHSDLNDEEEDQRGRDAVGEKRLYNDLETRTGFERPVRDSRENWDNEDANEVRKRPLELRQEHQRRNVRKVKLNVTLVLDETTLVRIGTTMTMGEGTKTGLARIVAIGNVIQRLGSRSLRKRIGTLVIAGTDTRADKEAPRPRSNRIREE